jgi:GH15 family glucan-1,4-alpha-glucosidase
MHTVPLRIRTACCGLVLFAAALTHSQTILLPDRWQFKTGDDSAYASPSYDDRDWKVIDVPSPWEPQGFEGYNGTAWYRVHFTVDPLPATNEPLTLALGKVDDADVTYLNGRRIGSMGRFPPDSLTAYQELRLYTIPRGLLRKNNVLAVRVYDMMGPGGIVFGPIGIYDKRARKAQFDPAPGPKRSFYELVTSNGLIAAVFNVQRGLIENVRPHIFQAYDSARFVEPYVYRIRPTLDEHPLTVSYRNQTHVITATYRDLEINYFAPFTTQEKIFYAAVRGDAQRVRACSFTYESGAARLIVDSLFVTSPGSRAVKYFLFGFTDSLHRDSSLVRIARARLASGATALVENETAFMRAVIARCRMPKNLPAAERRTLEQSITVLKMAQVSPKEIFLRSPGQILASLPPGGWNIAWVRDGTYAILGLNRLGLFDEAQRALAFMLHAASGHYVHYIHTDGEDYGVGVPYQISVCRYFGIGKEESDFGEVIGPNIELDGFGLFLSAFCDYIDRSRDTAFLAREYRTLAALVADAIVHSIDSSGLIRRDSGPWERHLPGKQFAYTSIACAAGLRDFATLIAKEHPLDSDTYQKASARLVNGIRTRLVVDHTLIKGNTEALDSTVYDYFDGGTFEAFADGLIAEKNLFASHYNCYRRALRVPKSIGFSRINKGDWYETAEWILLDLRAASALMRFGQTGPARALVNWVTAQAALNFNLIPELYNPKTSFYDGAVPMAGFGAGAYAVAIDDLYGSR